MKSPRIKYLFVQIIVMIVIFFALSPLFRSDESLEYNIGYSIIAGIIFGTLFYLFDLYRSKRR